MHTVSNEFNRFEKVSSDASFMFMWAGYCDIVYPEYIWSSAHFIQSENAVQINK